MARIVVAGAGLCGMAAGAMLARDGHEVTVVERDPDPQPADARQAWEGWERNGISQFRMGHVLLARGREVLKNRLPDVLDDLRSLGALEVPMSPPPSMESWTPQPDDDRYQMIGARRPVIDQAMANGVDRTDGLTLRRGVALAGLTVADERVGGIPHVTGVFTDDGEQIACDLLVDAMGRRSPMLRWLDAVGAPAPYEHSVDSGFAYYGNYFEARDGKMPTFAAGGLSVFDGYSILALPGDSGTWFIGVYASSNDKEMRALRDRDTLHALLAACPLHAEFIDGEPIGDVISMVGVADRDRRYVVDGAPVVTGMLPVADAWACTNPSLGRGMSIGLMHVEHLVDFMRSAPSDPREMAIAYDELTHREMSPWHEATRSVDQARAAELDAQRQGLPVEIDPDDIGAQIRSALNAAVPYNEDVFRMFFELFHLIDLPANIFARPGNLEKVIAAAEGRETPRMPGPTRAEFLETIA